MISKNFKIAIKLAGIPAWKIAYEVGVHPNVLLKILTGALKVKPGDERVLKVAKILRIEPEDCFDSNPLEPF